MSKIVQKIQKSQHITFFFLKFFFCVFFCLFGEGSKICVGGGVAKIFFSIFLVGPKKLGRGEIIRLELNM